MSVSFRFRVVGLLGVVALLAGCGASDGAGDDATGTADEALMDSYSMDGVVLEPDSTDSTATDVNLAEAASSTSCIRLRWYTASAGAGTACVGHPCLTNPDGTQCAVRRAIHRRFSAHYVNALSVAYCESRLQPDAANGQYHGLYQLSLAWREHFGIGAGYGIRGNVRAAHTIHSTYGWGPWECKPG